MKLLVVRLPVYQTTKDIAVDSCDSTSFTSHVDGNYNATMSLCTPEYSIWMGGT